MFNALGHLRDYFNGFLPNHVLTVNLNTFKVPFSPMLKSNEKEESSLVKWWGKLLVKGSIQFFQKNSIKETWVNQIAMDEKVFSVQVSASKSCIQEKPFLHNSYLIPLLTSELLNIVVWFGIITVSRK